VAKRRLEAGIPNLVVVPSADAVEAMWPEPYRASPIATARNRGAIDGRRDATSWMSPCGAPCRSSRSVLMTGPSI